MCVFVKDGERSERERYIYIERDISRRERESEYVFFEWFCVCVFERER